ncbi:hypothetical protein DIURU_003332 [Diutina rugosa]|uniref:Zinc finger CHCC-type domain-containing protein n=1 Tax=Diutina rugosa TaxID=5481 RepID=A0A642UKG8_DIURU|nr:uncharacterized protein DIURU_003332 [Diutina rugosa]KAA8900962.1 hypothetical protein DIURU_003332 [Diutina rugosa]
MISRTVRSTGRVIARRTNSTAASTGLTKAQLETNVNAKQAPNRADIWSASQEARIDVISKHPVRFVQRDLAEQPQPYAAIDLIAQQPIRYLGHGENIAVCDGNRGSTLQGHPKVFINLDQPKAATCGYCGLRYAKEEFKELIEGKNQ